MEYNLLYYQEYIPRVFFHISVFVSCTNSQNPKHIHSCLQQHILSKVMHLWKLFFNFLCTSNQTLSKYQNIFQKNRPRWTFRIRPIKINHIVCQNKNILFTEKLKYKITIFIYSYIWSKPSFSNKFSPNQFCTCGIRKQVTREFSRASAPVQIILSWKSSDSRQLFQQQHPHSSLLQCLPSLPSSLQ